MNTLNYVRLDDVISIDDLPDGTVIVADRGEFERPDPVFPELEWRRKFYVHEAERPDGTVNRHEDYRYETLMARRGVTDILDVNGDVCGFRVNGTERAVC